MFKSYWIAILCSRKTSSLLITQIVNFRNSKNHFSIHQYKMSAPPSQSFINTSSPNPDTKRITINTESKNTTKAKNPIDKNKAIITAFRIALTLFYGQFVANGIYDNLIRTIPYLVDKSPPVTWFQLNYQLNLATFLHFYLKGLLDN